MKPPPFDYHVAESVDEAVALLGSYGEDAKVLAGGQSLVPLLALRLARPERLVDINRLEELGRVDSTGGMYVGALVRHRAIAGSNTSASGNPLLSAAARYIGHAAIRNRGTVGGSISHADPAAELPAVLIALDGEVEVSSQRGARSIRASEFFRGFLTTALEPDELVVGIRLPEWVPGSGWSFLEFSRRSGDFAVAGVAVMLRLDSDGRITEARIGLSGMSDTPRRASGAESVLIGSDPSGELWSAASEEAVRGLEPPSDLHGTSAYRRHLAKALLRSACEEAHTRAVTYA